MTGWRNDTELADRAAALGVVLRAGRHDQLDQLEPLWLSLFDHHLAHGAAGFPVIERQRSWPRRRRLYTELLEHPDTLIITAHRAGRPIGYCLAHVHEGADDTWPTGERIGEIESLAVLPTERGGGIGTLLLDAAEAHLADRGARDIVIGVLAGNDSALAFYQRRGLAPALVKLLRLHPGAT